MKNFQSILVVICAVIMMASPQFSLAQFDLSLGAEGAMIGSRKSGSSTGLGTSLGGELRLGKYIGIAGQTGLIFMVPRDQYGSSYMLPLHGGLKFYVKANGNGVYLQGFYGVHLVHIEPGNIAAAHFFNNSESGLSKEPSFNVGLGYVANERIDIVFRYNYVGQKNYRVGYVGIRVAYTFGKQDKGG